jgi:hypothetical protein
LFDNAREDLERNGWRVFIEKFEGFNLAVAQQFALTFDGCRAKIGDIQLEVELRISLAQPLVCQPRDKDGLKIQRLTKYHGHYCLPQGRSTVATKVCPLQLLNLDGMICWLLSSSLLHVRVDTV